MKDKKDERNKAATGMVLGKSRSDRAEELFRQGYLQGYSDPENYERKKELYALIQKMTAEFKQKEGTIICRELLNLKKGEDIAEPSVRTEDYYNSRPCIGACRAAAEIAEKYLLKSSD